LLLCHSFQLCCSESNLTKDVFADKHSMLLCSIFFQSWWVKNCIEIVCKFSSVIIERWSDFWCKLIHTLHLHVINCIFSLLKIKSIIVNWLWILQVIVSDFSSSFSLAFVMMFSRISAIICQVKHLHSFQCEWCRLKSFMANCLQSFLNSLFKREIVESFSVNVINSEFKL